MAIDPMTGQDDGQGNPDPTSPYNQPVTPPPSPGGAPAANPLTTWARQALSNAYKMYLGRDISDQEFAQYMGPGASQQSINQAIEGVRTSPESTAYQQQNPRTWGQPPTAPGPTNTATNTGGGNGDYTAFGQAWLASGGKTVADLRNFVAAHPEYGAVISGSAGGNVRIGGREFDAVIGSHTGGTGASWRDTAATSGGGGNTTGQGIDPTYLAPWTKEFAAPEGSSVQPFQAPTTNDDPSFNWRLGQLKGAVENSAAGRGVLNSGGTLYNLGSNLSNFINQDYGNVFNRAVTAWGANKQGADDVYGRAWQNFIENKDTFYRNQNEPFNKIARIAGIGANAAAQ